MKVAAHLDNLRSGTAQSQLDDIGKVTDYLDTYLDNFQSVAIHLSSLEYKAFTVTISPSCHFVVSRSDSAERARVHSKF